TVEQAVAHAIVQPVWLPLPELDHVGQDAIAAPVHRPRYRPIAVRAGERRDLALETLAIRHHLGLWRCNRAELTIARPRRAVCVGSGGADPLDAALDPDLPV